MQKYMNKCLELARKGLGKTSPNPLVGCVVLNKDGEIISTGYHAEYGKNHAERDALLKLNIGDAEGGTLFVNLEPCSHYGKTPPCTDLIIEHKIKTVVIGMRDPNPKVDGVSILRNAGIDVIEGVMEDECRKLNEVFLTNQLEKRTFVAIKTATTLDGKVATSNGSSKWITSEMARNEVKFIREKYDAILTTSATVNSDNPTMLHRKKVILDRNLITDLSSKIYQQGEIFIFHSKEKVTNGCKNSNIKYIFSPMSEGLLDLEFMLKKLYELGIMSVLVESGGRLNGKMLEYTDKIYNFIAPKIVGDNRAKSSFDFREVFDINDADVFNLTDVMKFPPDVLLILHRQN